MGLGWFFCCVSWGVCDDSALGPLGAVLGVVRPFWFVLQNSQWLHMRVLPCLVISSQCLQFVAITFSFGAVLDSRQTLCILIILVCLFQPFDRNMWLRPPPPSSGTAWSSAFPFPTTNPKPQTLNPKPQTPNPKHPKP